MPVRSNGLQVPSGQRCAGSISSLFCACGPSSCCRCCCSKACGDSSKVGVPPGKPRHGPAALASLSRKRTLRYPCLASCAAEARSCPLPPPSPRLDRLPAPVEDRLLLVPAVHHAFRPAEREARNPHTSAAFWLRHSGKPRRRVASFSRGPCLSNPPRLPAFDLCRSMGKPVVLPIRLDAALPVPSAAVVVV